MSVKSAMEIAASIDTQKYEPIYIGITKVRRLEDLREAVRRLGEGRLPPSRDLAGQRDARAAHRRERRMSGSVTSTRCSRSCTASRVKTEQCRACSSCRASRMWAATSRARRSAWTSRSRTSSPGTRGSTRLSSRILNGDDAAVPDDLGYPVFVKPARSGSSFGVSKVDRADDVDAALAAARQYRQQGPDRAAVLGVRGWLRRAGKRCRAVRRRSGSDQAAARPLSHPSGGRAGDRAPRTRSITVPADLPEGKREQIRETAKSIYTALGCEGLARVDMFLASGWADRAQ